MSEVRVGYVSSIDYENGLCEIHYPDRDDTVTEMVPFLSNREYRTPEVEDMVLVLHPGDSPEDAVVVGTIWNEKIKPAEGKKIHKMQGATFSAVVSAAFSCGSDCPT